MSISRRGFLAGSMAAACAGWGMKPAFGEAGSEPTTKPALDFHIGSCALSIQQAKEAGLDGIEVQAGGMADTLNIADPGAQKKYQEQMLKHHVPIQSIALNVLNSHPLASEPRGPAWLEQSIDAATALGAAVVLLQFFGRGSLGDARRSKPAEIDAVVNRLKAVAAKAEKANVVLGLENALPASENAKLLQQVNSPAVKVYYDIFNANSQGYDAPAEIRFLKDRIVQFHFKEGAGYLGQGGTVKWDKVADAIRDINYQGWIMLETGSPSRNVVADAKKNAEFVRQLFAGT